MVNIHTGKSFNIVKNKTEMIGYYLGEFEISYKRETHVWPGVGATHSFTFVSIK